MSQSGRQEEKHSSNTETVVKVVHLTADHTEIKYRMSLTHTASILRTWSYWHLGWERYTFITQGLSFWVFFSACSWRLFWGQQRRSCWWQTRIWVRRANLISQSNEDPGDWCTHLSHTSHTQSGCYTLCQYTLTKSKKYFIFQFSIKITEKVILINRKYIIRSAIKVCCNTGTLTAITCTNGWFHCHDHNPRVLMTRTHLF